MVSLPLIGSVAVIGSRAIPDSFELVIGANEQSTVLMMRFCYLAKQFVRTSVVAGHQLNCSKPDSSKAAFVSLIDQAYRLKSVALAITVVVLSDQPVAVEAVIIAEAVEVVAAMATEAVESDFKEC